MKEPSRFDWFIVAVFVTAALSIAASALIELGHMLIEIIHYQIYY